MPVPSMKCPSLQQDYSSSLWWIQVWPCDLLWPMKKSWATRCHDHLSLCHERTDGHCPSACIPKWRQCSACSSVARARNKSYCCKSPKLGVGALFVTAAESPLSWLITCCAMNRFVLHSLKSYIQGLAQQCDWISDMAFMKAIKVKLSHKDRVLIQ